jgi:DNA-binding NtrC family response regulator
MNLLHLEDSEADAELIGKLVESEWPDATIERVQTRGEFTDALVHSKVDLILADVALPAFDGMAALAIAQDVRPEVPFIFLSGTMGEEEAIETLRNGATDYILKDRIGRLIPAIRRALTEGQEAPMAEPGDLNSRLALRFVHLEDSASDAELAAHAIGREWPDATIERVQSRDAFTAALQNPNLDMILSDFSMPGFDGLSALAIAQSRRPDVPFIFVSGTIGEENAISALRKGASDYILKDRMRRLRPAIRRALDEFKDRRNPPKAGSSAPGPAGAPVQAPGGPTQHSAKGPRVGLWDWDLLTNESWISEGVYSTLGYSPGEIPANVDAWANLVHLKEARRVSDKVVAALGGKAARWSDEFHVRHKSGQYVLVRVEGMIGRDETGSPVQIAGTLCRIS